MKQIFDWLREQYMQRKALWEDKSVADRFSAEKHIGTWNKALEILDIAEAKWEAECCEWEWFEVDGVRTYANCKYSRDTLDLREMSDFQFCPYCGRKIAEVE